MAIVLLAASPVLFSQSAGADKVASSAPPASPQKASPAKIQAARLQISSKAAALPLEFFPAPESGAGARFTANGMDYSLTLGDASMTLTSRRILPPDPATPSAALKMASAADPQRSSRGPAPRMVIESQRIDFLGANREAKPQGLNPAGTYANFFLGSDPSKWRGHVTGFSRVKYSNLYPGIDLVYHGEMHGKLEYDFAVAPGADPQQIRLRIVGDREARIGKDGALELDGPDGIAQLDRPMLYQNMTGGKRAIAGGFVQLAKNEFGFRATAYDRSRPLIIDPTINLLYSTYLGGRHDDDNYDLEIDSSGNTYLCGRSASEDFPVSGNAYQTIRQNVGTYTYDAFVMKFDASGTLLYSTFLGGSSNDAAGRLALDAAGNAYVIGSTNSTDFPVTSGALQTVFAGANDGFISVFSPDGSQLLYSTFLGTPGNSGIGVIKSDGNGAFLIAGTSSAAGLPTTAGVYQPANSGQANAFVGRIEFSPQWKLKIDQLTYFGGSGGADPTYVNDLTQDSTGNIYIGGQTEESTLPLTSDALVKTFTSSGGCYISSTPYSMGFVSELSPDLSKLLYSSYFGGQTEATANVHQQVGCAQRVITIHVDSTGQIFMTGNTSESDFPVTSNAMRNMLNGDGGAGFDDFVSILSADHSKLVYSSYLGGANFEYNDVAVWDSQNNIWIFGATDSTDFPVTKDALQPANGGSTDASLTELSPDGTKILYSTYFGGSGAENQQGARFAIDSNGTFHLGGSTTSTDFPVTPSAFQSALANGGQYYDGPDVYFTLLGNGAIGAVGPVSGGNTGDTTITIGGAGFAAGATCKLMEGTTTIASVLATVSAGGTSIACTFPLNGVMAGVYDVVVVNPDGSTFTKQGGFTVQSGGQPVIWANILGRPKIRINTPSTFNVTYGNSGNVDAYGIPMSISLPSTFTLDIPDSTTTTSLPSGRRVKAYAASTPVATPGELYFTDTTTGNNVIQMNIPHLAPGESVSIPFQVTDATDADAWTVGVNIDSPAYSSIAQAQTALSSLSPAASCAPANGGLQDCLSLDAASYVADVLGTFSDMGKNEGFTFDSAQATTTFTQYYAAAMADLINQNTAPPGPGLRQGAPPVAESSPRPEGFGVTVSCCNSINIVNINNGSSGPVTIMYNGLPSVTTIPAIGNNKLLKDEVIGPLAKQTVDKLQNAVEGQLLHSPANLCSAAGAAAGGTGVFIQQGPQSCGACNAGIKICNNQYSCNITPFAGQPYTTIVNGVPYPVPCDPNNPKFCKKKKKKAIVHPTVDGLDELAALNPVPLDGGSGDGCDDGGSGGSIDPNYKTGPAGDGSASQYVPGAKALAYNVGFENEPKATLPAAQVVVTDQLDPNKVDLTTLTLGAVSFGTNVIDLPGSATNYNTTFKLNSSLSVRIQGSLDTTSGLLKWTFTSIDPSTGVPPTDPSVGFLPPDVDGVQGQGSVLFSVTPKAGQTTGTQIANMATVVFDTNAPINTPTWVNTLDVDPPGSKVTALPAKEATSGQTAAFTVSWSGTDKGSGIDTYNVYVSDNSGAFTQWQSGVAATSASYTGTLGHSYGFYSIATDLAGNVEAAKTTADTSTIVAPPTPLVSGTKLTASAASIPAGSSVTFTSVVSPPSGTAFVPTGTVTFLNGTTTLGMATLDGSGTATLSTTTLPVGTDAITAKYSGDAIFAGSTSASVNIVVGNPGFSVTVTPSSLTVTNGSSATATIAVTSVFAFSASTSFACGNLPANATCTFSPSTVTPAAGAGATTTLTIAAGVNPSAAVVNATQPKATEDARAGGLRLWPLSLLFLLPWGVALARRRKAVGALSRLMMLLAAAGAFAVLSGCGGGGNSHATPKGTSTVTVTATSGAISQTINIQLTVN